MKVEEREESDLMPFIGILETKLERGTENNPDKIKRSEGKKEMR